MTITEMMFSYFNRQRYSFCILFLFSFILLSLNLRTYLKHPQKMKKILDILYSTRLMAVLFFLFTTTMGVATFIENDYGTQTSKALVYNSWWFEGIMVFFVINFFGNIFRYQLHKKKKWPVLMFHLSFLLILIGAGITRYVGYEGIMLINEGESTNKFLSETTYLNVVVDNNKEQKTQHKKMLLSAWGKNTWNYEDDI